MTKEQDRLASNLFYNDAFLDLPSGLTGFYTVI